MRSLLLHTHDDACFEARYQVALDLARAFDGHLTLVQSVAYDVVVPTDPFGVSTVDISAASREIAEDFRSKIEARLQQEDVRWGWHVEYGYEGQSLVRHAALNDLAIVGGTPADGDGRRASSLAGMLAIHCRTPILLVPEKAQGLQAGGAAVVCWNGSMEAARATRAAVPLLAKAEMVHILCVGETAKEGDEAMPASLGAAYLERHGIDCEIVELPAGSEPVHQTLRKAAEVRHATVMVMGAYGQPRIIETLFGGVTRSVLGEPPMPVLMAH